MNENERLQKYIQTLIDNELIPDDGTRAKFLSSLEEAEQFMADFKHFVAEAYKVCDTYHNLRLELDRYSRWYDDDSSVTVLAAIGRLYRFVDLTVDADFSEEAYDDIQNARIAGLTAMRSLSRVLLDYAEEEGE